MNALDKNWVSVRQAADATGYTKRWIQMLLKGEEGIGHQKAGNQFLVWLPDVRRYARLRLRGDENRNRRGK